MADKQRHAEFLQAYDEKNRLEREGENMVLVIGKDDWPFPIPLVQQKSGGWVFNTAKGKEEILNRRIGQNELNTIQAALAYIDAQREYAMKDHDGDGLLEYAQKFRSDPGTKMASIGKPRPAKTGARWGCSRLRHSKKATDKTSRAINRGLFMVIFIAFSRRREKAHQAAPTAIL